MTLECNLHTTRAVSYTHLMRTLYKQNGETTLPCGVDLIFTMDEEGNITMDQGTYEVESGTSVIAEGNALLYYDCKQYPDKHTSHNNMNCNYCLLYTS